MRTFTKLLGIAVLAAGAAAATYAFTQRPATDPLDDAILDAMRRDHVPGLSLLVLRDGKVVKEKGYGYANVEHEVPVTPDTVFQSGSIGKTFTAALIVLLARDGKLSLDDPIARHLDGAPPAWEGITIRHLLTHTAGLGDPYDELDLQKNYTDEELLALEANIPLIGKPGGQWAYSNMGYHVLGFIANKAGGKFYGEQLRERIFSPLGMGTRMISEADIVPHRAAGYEWRDDKLHNQSWVSPSLNTTADGSLYLTARDLAKWDQALYGDKILGAAERTASWTPVRLNDGTTAPYGFGWFLEPVNGHRAISHSGAWQGFNGYLGRYPDDKLTVIVLANSNSALSGRYANLAAAHFVPALKMQPRAAIVDDDPATAERLRAALTALTGGKVPDGMSAAGAALLKPGVVATLAKSLADAGALRSIELLDRGERGGQRISRYRVTWERDAGFVVMRVDRDGKIAALEFAPG